MPGALAEASEAGVARAGRAVLVALLAWWTLRLASGAASHVFLDFVNLAFHEAGHVFTSPFGITVHVLGGTLGQLVVPALLVWYFMVRRRSAFGAACCAWWLGESLVNVSVYMADARELALPLVGGGEHDWNELFFRFGVLDEPSVRAISGTTRAVGIAVMLVGLAWAGCFLFPRLRRRLALRLAAVAPRAVRLLGE
jgi:hypothetical protein